jgi:hypothetical protein
MVTEYETQIDWRELPVPSNDPIFPSKTHATNEPTHVSTNFFSHHEFVKIDSEDLSVPPY